MLCRMMKDFLCKPGSGCCTNDLNQFAMATPRGATESVWIVCFGNKRVQTNQVNAKSFKMSCISLIKFPKSKQTEPTETQLKRQVNSAGQKLNFHCVHWQQSMNSPLITKQEAVPRHTVNDKWLVWKNRSTGSWRRLQRFGKQLWRNRRRVSRQFCVFPAIPCISKAVLIDAGNLLWK